MSTKKPTQRSTTKPADVAKPVFERVGFLGLGIMGSAMAGNLMKAGFEVHGFDPTPKARQHFKAAGGHVSSDPADLVRSAQVVICSLPSAAALLETSSRVSRKRTLI
jgi:putative dehydrogenase